MKSISKKNIKKTKFSKKNKTIHKTIHKTKIQKGGVFNNEDIGEIETIMREIVIDGGYNQSFNKVYHALALKLHPDKQVGKPDTAPEKYKAYFNIINDFNTWVKDHSELKGKTWNQIIKELKLQENLYELQEYYERNTFEKYFKGISFVDNVLKNIPNMIIYSGNDAGTVLVLIQNIQELLGTQFDELKNNTIKDLYLRFNIPSKESVRNSTSTSTNNSKQKKLELERDAIGKKIEKLIEEQIKLDTEITKLTSKSKLLEEKLKSEMENIETINNELSKL